jgi:uncharacterized protein
MTMLILIIALLYIGLMIVLANIEQVRGESHPLLTVMQIGLALLIAVWVMNGVIFMMASPEQVADPEFTRQLERIDKTMTGFFILLGCVAILVIIGLIRSSIPHQWIEHYLYKKSDNQLYSYDSTLSVHKLAIMLVIVQVVAVVWTFTLSGGVGGLDFSYDTPLKALADLATGALMYVTLALLGVGWLIRRNFKEVSQRLSLRFPTRQDWMMGIAMAIALYMMLLGASAIWTASVSSDVLEQQTAASQQLFEAFNSSLLLGVMLALLTGFSEEILFRGALQPVFGLVPTSIFFTIIHIQYTLTPATIIIFIVSLGFGWLRRHISTTSAIIAHMTYNFIPFLLFTLATNSGAL